MNTATRWDEIKALFHRAVELSPDAREALLEGACGNDPAVRGEVESLLASYDRPTSFLRTVGPLGLSAVDLDDLEGQRVGAYRLLRRIGSGGMGAVYHAVRADATFDKDVAIKVVKRGMDTEDVVRRFTEERQTLARLHHPHITALLDGGSTDDGRPFLVMEYVSGARIDRYCARERLSLPARLRLFETVCRAVQHAHQALVIHRDLKPDNILVTDEGEPKLLDFGIAKVLADPAHAPAVTQLVDRRMTLAYASPEQVRGEPMTTVSDVYSLGVVLYELLTGCRPYARSLETPIAFERAMQEGTPPPSARTRGVDTRPVTEMPAPTSAELAAERQATVAGLTRALRGDLDHIVLKAMHADPARRYGSAGALADDLRRHLDGHPVVARPDRVAYRAAKFVRRHTVGVAAAVMVVLAVAAGVGGVWWQARIARAERDRAQAAARKAEQITAFLVDMLGAADPDASGRDVTVAEVLTKAAERTGRELRDQPVERATLQWTIGSTFLRLGRIDQAEPLLREVLETRRRLLPRNSPDLAQAVNELGGLLQNKGEFDEAERLYREARDIYVAAYGPRHEMVANAMDNIGSVLQTRGDLAKAEQQHRETLALRRSLRTDANADVARSLNNLAVVVGTLGRWDEAVGYHREALAVFEKLPEHRRELAAAMSSLATAIEATGKYDEAETYYRQALALRTELLGESHPDTAWTIYNYASMLEEMGQPARAEPMARRVLAMRGPTLPDKSPIVAASLQVAGRSAQRLGRLEQAERDLRESLALRAAALPPTHWLLASAKSVLGECLGLRGKRAEAEALLVAGYEGLESALGPTHERTVLAATRLASFYRATGRPALAARYVAAH